MLTGLVKPGRAPPAAVSSSGFGVLDGVRPGLAQRVVGRARGPVASMEELGFFRRHVWSLLPVALSGRVPQGDLELPGGGVEVPGVGAGGVRQVQDGGADRMGAGGGGEGGAARPAVGGGAAARGRGGRGAGGRGRATASPRAAARRCLMRRSVHLCSRVRALVERGSRPAAASCGVSGTWWSGGTPIRSIDLAVGRRWCLFGKAQEGVVAEQELPRPARRSPRRSWCRPAGRRAGP